MTAADLDLVVVGGGIHGVGVAQCAAAAGWSTLLIEERELAFGTSSRSSKLIHGGLRYLETGQWQLVRESLAERELLIRLAPDLVRLVPFHIPIYRDTRRRPWQIRAGLSLYALLGNLARDARYDKVPRSRWDELDGLATDGLESVFRYFDGQTDDAALVRAVARSAIELGARVEVGCALRAAVRESGAWRLELAQGGRERTVRALAWVNAAGPWVDAVESRVEPAGPRPPIELVGGTHVELEGALARGIYYTEASDGRAIFHMPWKGRTLVGTTERRFAGRPETVAPTPEEIAYLTATFERHFPARAATVIDAWAGLRVLPAAPTAAFARPREVQLVLDDRTRPSHAAIYGGKLTGYRATAEKVVAALRPGLPQRAAIADTATLRLRGDA